MYVQKRLVYDTDRDRIDVLTRNYQYGKNWDVPKEYGNELQVALVDYKFKIYVSDRQQLVIYKTDMATDGVIITDNGGEFNLDRYGYNQIIGTVNYVINDTAVSPQTLDSLIREIYVDNFEVPKSEEKPAEAQAKSKEDIEKYLRGE